MATEADELRLTVTLVDNASAGLKTLQQQMHAMGGGQATENMNRFRRGVEETHKGLEPFLAIIEKAGKQVMPTFTDAFVGGARAMLGFGLGAGGALLGVAKLVSAIADLPKKVSEAASELRKLGQLGELTGQHAAQLREIQRVYERAGLGSKFQEDITGLTASMFDLQKVQSTIRQQMQGGIINPQQAANMQRALLGLSRDDLPGFINELEKFGAQVEENAKRRLRRPGVSEDAINAGAAKVKDQFFADWGGRYLALIHEQVRKTTDEENKHLDESIAKSELLLSKWTTIEQKMSDIGEHFTDKMAGPLIELFDWLDKKLDEYKAWLNAPHIPAVPPQHRGDSVPNTGASGKPRSIPHMQHGGLVPQDMFAMLHAGEIVQPASGVGAIEDQTRATKELTDEMRKLVTLLTGTVTARMGGLAPGLGVGPGVVGAAGAAGAPLGILGGLLGGVPGIGGLLGGGGPLGVLGGLLGGGGGLPGIAQRMLGGGGLPGIAQRLLGPGLSRMLGGPGADGGTGPVEQLAEVRQRIAEELKDPDTARLLAASTAAEVGGQGPVAAQAYMESVMNRAISRNKSLRDTLNDPHYYPQSTLQRLDRSINPKDQAAYDEIANKVISTGSNITGFATGNASAGVGVGQPTFNPGTGDYYGIETPDAKWASQMRAIASSAKASKDSREAGPGGGQVQGDVKSVMRGVDPRLVEAAQAGAKYLPEGYTLRPVSGREGREGQDYGLHPSGMASDWQIYGPDGKPIANRGDDESGLYTQWARGVYTEALKNDPELAKRLGWGGAFATVPGGNVPDLMHIDEGGMRGRLRPQNILSNLGPYSRAEADRLMTHQVNGNASIDVNVNAPRNTFVKAAAKGLFKQVSINRQTQMESAQSSTGLGEE